MQRHGFIFGQQVTKRLGCEYFGGFSFHLDTPDLVIFLRRQDEGLEILILQYSAKVNTENNSSTIARCIEHYISLHVPHYHRRNSSITKESHQRFVHTTYVMSNSQPASSNTTEIYMPAHSMLKHLTRPSLSSCPPSNQAFFTPVPNRPPPTMSMRSISSSQSTLTARKCEWNRSGSDG